MTDSGSHVSRKKDLTDLPMRLAKIKKLYNTLWERVRKRVLLGTAHGSSEVNEHVSGLTGHQVAIS